MQIDATIEQRDLKLFREEALFHAAREVRRLIDVAAGRDDRDVRIPSRRRADIAQRREHRARLPQREITAPRTDVTDAHDSRRAALMNS